MKKALKITLGAALATSALTPVAALAAEEVTPTQAKTGIYNIKTGEFISKAEFKALTKAQRKDVLFGEDYYLATGGLVYPASAIILPTEELTAAGTEEAEFEAANEVELTENGHVLDKDGNRIGEDKEPPAPELVVESVSAVNPSTIALELNQEVEEFDIKDVTATPVLNIETATIEGNVVYLSLKTPAAFNSSYKLDIKDLGEHTVEFGGVNDYYTLQFEYDVEDNNGNGIVDVPATGASTLQVTAQVVDLEGNEVDTQGVIRFTTTAGGIAQGEKTLQNGKASIQLTSEASLHESIFASITGEIVGSSKLIGLKSSDIVEFAPESGTGEIETAVNVVKVESPQADRFQAVLGQPRAKLSTDELTALKNAIKVTDGIKESRLAVKEVIQLSPTVLEVVLDTEANSNNHFTDNAKHEVEFAPVKNVITAGKLDFILTDTSKQFVLNVAAEDQQTLLVNYSEPVAFFSNSYFNGVDEDDFLKNTHTYDGNEALAAYFGNLYKNYAIDGVTISKNSQFTLSADRKTVKISLTKADAIKVKETNLEIKNVGDWAGTVDPKNRISTQRIEFTANIDETVPALKVERQSPEQFVVSVDKDVTLKSGSNLADVLETRYGGVLLEDEGTAKKGDLAELFNAVDGAQSSYAPETVVYTAYDEKWNKVDANAGEQFRYILVELTQDWTEVVPGENYWVASPQVQFKLGKNLLSSNLDNKNVEFNVKVSNDRDRTSPQVAVGADGKKLFKQIDQAIEYTMNEPVQVVSNDKDWNKESSSGVAITPNAQQQAANDTQVQATEINFEKDGVVVPGVVTALDPTDRTIVAGAKYLLATGDTALEAAVEQYNLDKELAGDDKLSHYGEWTVTITGTPDDFGNTMATEEFVASYKVEAPGETLPTDPTPIDPFVVYGQYFNDVPVKDGTQTPDVSEAGNGEDFDVILLKFSEVIANTGANAVGDTTNYVLNGRTLADLGSSIEKGIDGVTNDWDGITIKLPAGTLGADANFVLTVADNMVSKDDGTKLIDENELNFVDTDLTGDTTHTSVYAPKLFFTNSQGQTPVDALTKLFIKPGSGSTTATVFDQGDDEDLAKDLEVQFTLVNADGTAAATQAIQDALNTNLQVVINGKVVNVAPSIGANGVVTLTVADAKALAIKENGRVEVKINGQTVHVSNVTTP